VGYQNFKVKDIAEMVKKIIGPQVSIKTTSTDDNRSYHVSSQKIKAELGFESKHSVEDAISDLKKAFDDGKLPGSLDDIRYFNIKTMQALNMK
jgi:nucleoside-diphosphate-sugar epimerase